ncbi:CPSF A subunit region [Nakaseomyces glabratus]|nr:CPSF A subunit region [Nakaseomyces glabratus]
MELYHLTLQRQSNYVHSVKGSFLGRDSNELVVATQTHIELYDFAGKVRRKVGNDIVLFTSLLALDTIWDEDGLAHLVMLGQNGNLVVAKFALSGDRLQLDSEFLYRFDNSVEKTWLPKVVANKSSILVTWGLTQKIVVPVSWSQEPRFRSPIFFSNAEHSVVLELCSLTSFEDHYVSLELDTRLKVYKLNFLFFDRNLQSLLLTNSYNLKSNEVDDRPNFITDIPDLAVYGVSTAINKSTSKKNPFVLIGFNKHILIKDMMGIYSLKCEFPADIMESLPMDKKLLIVASDLQILKNNVGFLLLLQTNTGHLFKVIIFPNEEDRNRPIAKLGYFDKVKHISNSSKLHLFNNGSMYINSQFNYDHVYLNFESIGDNDENYDKIDNENENISVISKHTNINPIASNLCLMENMPLTFMHFQGGNRTTDSEKVNIIRNAIPLKEYVSSPLPQGVSNIFTIKTQYQSYHSFIFLTMINFTTVILKIADDSIEQYIPASDTFKLKDDMTIHVATMGDNSIIQVCKDEFRQILLDSKDEENFKMNLKWYPPAGVSILSAVSNFSQLILALSNNEIVYLQLENNTLIEYKNRFELPDVITSLALLNDNTKKSEILAVGTSDNMVNVLSLEIVDEAISFETVVFQALDAIPSSLLILNQGHKLVNLHIGVEDGSYLVNRLDLRNMSINNILRKQLGTRSIKALNHIGVDLRNDTLQYDDDESDNSKENTLKNRGEKTSVVVIHGNRTWANYSSHSNMYIRPLYLKDSRRLITTKEFSSASIDSGGSCCSLSASGSLLIGGFDFLPWVGNWFSKDAVAIQLSDDSSTAVSGGDSTDGSDDDEDYDEEKLEEFDIHCRKFLNFNDQGKSTVLVFENTIDDKAESTLCIINKKDISPMTISDDGKSVFRKSLPFKTRDVALSKLGTKKWYLFVLSTSSTIFTYGIKTSTDGTVDLKMELIHETHFDNEVFCIKVFRDMLIVPQYNRLLFCEVGKTKLLNKMVGPAVDYVEKITVLDCWADDRIAIGDFRNSVSLLQFSSSHEVNVIANDICTRDVTAIKFLDRSTIIGGDKFGSVWVLRLSIQDEKILQSCDNNKVELQQHLLREKGTLREKAPNILNTYFKLDLVNQFFINDIVTGFSVEESTQASDRPIIFYYGIQGTIGCLLPLLVKSEISKLRSIEQMMKSADETWFLKNELLNEKIGIELEDKENHEYDLAVHSVIDHEVGRTAGNWASSSGFIEGKFTTLDCDHTAYRSYYAPVKNVIDGDICETYLNLTDDLKAYLTKHASPDNDLTTVVQTLMKVRNNFI